MKQAKFSVVLSSLITLRLALVNMALFSSSYALMNVFLLGELAFRAFIYAYLLQEVKLSISNIGICASLRHHLSPPRALVSIDVRAYTDEA